MYRRQGVEISEDKDLVDGENLVLSCITTQLDTTQPDSTQPDSTQPDTTQPDTNPTDNLHPTWKWFLDQNQLFSEIIANQTYTELKWTGVGSEQDGEYRCVLETKLETVQSQPVRVRVFKPSRLRSGSIYQEVVEGSSVDLGTKLQIFPQLFYF